MTLDSINSDVVFRVLVAFPEWDVVPRDGGKYLISKNATYKRRPDTHDLKKFLCSIQKNMDRRFILDWWPHFKERCDDGQVFLEEYGVMFSIRLNPQNLIDYISLQFKRNEQF